MNKFTVFTIALLLSHSLFAQSDYGTFSQNIKESKVDDIKLLVSVNGGTLNFTNNVSDLADVNFEYDKQDWDPSVSFTENGDHGKLEIKALTGGENERVNDHNICDISLSDNYNYSLGILLGAGVANLNFENYSIDKALFRLGVGSFKINLANTSVPLLKIEAGIGEAKIDLTGEWKNNLSAQIKAGIGDITFYVPADVGVKFTISGFLGDISAKGFNKNDKEYTNSSFGQTKHQLELTVNGAIGSITIIEK